MSERFKEALKWSSAHREKNKNKNVNIIKSDKNETKDKPLTNTAVNIVIIFVLLVIVSIMAYVGYKYYFADKNIANHKTVDYDTTKNNIIDPIEDLKKQSLNDSFSFSI